MGLYKCFMLSLLLFCTSSAWSAITLTSSNAYNTRTSGSSTAFTWPVVDTAAINTTYCRDAKIYRTARLDPALRGELLRFTITSDVMTTTANKYVHAEIVTGGAVVLLDRETATADPYTGYSGAGTTFTISLGDLCDADASGTEDCQFAVTATLQESLKQLALRVGVTDGQVPFCSSASDSSCGTTGTTSYDYETFLFEFPRCATMNPAYYTLASDNYSYGLSVQPGDSSARVSLTWFPTMTGTYFPYKQVIYLFEESTATRTTPMATTSAQVVTEVGGEPAISSRVVGALGNDRTYNVQVAFVNVGGFITPPGPPKYANGGLTPTTAPQVTPSKIEGVLKDDVKCFIATAAFGSSSAYAVEVLREFRGKFLMNNSIGRRFVHWYYGWAPLHAQQLEEHPGWKPVIRVMLWPVTLIAQISLWLKSNNSAVLIFVIAVAMGSLFLAWFATRKRGTKVKGKNEK